MRDNYYILLELDPSVRDEASINDAISNKAGQWSRDRNHPRNGTVAQKYLAMLPDIKKVLLNPVARNTEADAALKIILDKKAKNEKKLKVAAKGLVRNGSIKEDDLIKLAKTFGFSEDEVERILKVHVMVTPKDDGIEMLEESLIMSIRSDLNVVRKKDLFDFLGLNQETSCTDLVFQATNIYNKYSKNANKTAEVTATTSLSNVCIQRLKDEVEKEKYIKSLHYEYFGELKEFIDLWASKGSIDATGYHTLLSMVEDKNIPPKRLDFFIYDYCRKKGLEIDMSLPEADTTTPIPTPSTPPITFTITFDSQGGSFVASQTVEQKKKAIQLSSPTLAGHKFDGWYKESACVNIWNFATDAVVSDTTLFAKWTKLPSKNNKWIFVGVLLVVVVALLLIFNNTERQTPTDNIATTRIEPAITQPAEIPTPQPILVESISLNQSTLSLEVGQNRTLTTTIHPANASNRNVEWSSSNTSVATVNNGVVTAVSQGSTVITATSADGSNVVATSSVTVTQQQAAMPNRVTPPTTQQAQPVETTINYSFGRYTGMTLNGIPHGRGTMHYTCRIQIARHGRAVHFAENGDRFEGTWHNGDIEHGTLTRSNGEQLSIRAGRRPSPHNLNNDRCE